jgi:Type I phosphodiesterase / nucleotide pyrophosphatase
LKNEPPKPPLNNSNRLDGAGQEPTRANSLQDVRDRLQSFGYLNSRIERFYSSSISRSASQLLNRTLLSLRVGILAGTLAAILMMAGTLVFNQELLNHKFDLILLFLYFEIFFVALISFLELALIYAVSLLLRYSGGRWIHFAGQAVSFVIGLSFFGYFFYWGQTQFEYLRLLSTPSLIIILFILILSSLFVARCAWLGFLVAFRESNLGRILPNWKRYGIEAVLSLIAVLILLPFVAEKHEKKTANHGPIAVFSTPDQWIVLGVDGVSEENLQRFLNSEDLPNLKDLYSHSFLAKLQVSDPVIPPVNWTTIATGVPPAEHGILTPEVRRWRGLSSWIQTTPFELAMRSILIDTGLGQRQPVSGYLRKSKTFWEILSDYGIRAGVVNWWGSWPAQSMRGWNISERYYYKLLSNQPEQAETFPLPLFNKYRKFFRGTSKIKGPDLDLFYTDVFMQQMKTDPVRVGALYLPGFDILNYDFFHFKNMDPFTYSDKYRNHLQWLDDVAGRIQREYPDYNLMVIFYQGRSLENDHSAILIHSPGNETEKNLHNSISELTITPLLLYTCGVPVGRSMNQSLISALFASPQVPPAFPIRFVDSYPKTDQLEPGHLSEFNDLLVEQMKSLGYLQ